MVTTVALAVGVPGLVAAAACGLRRRVAGTATDVRGIALQTVIITVVLLAVAGGISALLLARGDRAAEELEAPQFRYYTRYTIETDCDLAGFNWVAAAGGVAAHCTG